MIRYINPNRKNINRLAVRSVESTEELCRANDLMIAVHAPESGGQRWLRNLGNRYPGFRREHTRIAVLKKQIAGALRLHTETIRIGEARLKMGGIGWVTTAVHHRGKGVCRALLNDTLEYMKNHGYHVSMLFGIPGLYQKFGYATCLADYGILVDTADGAAYACPATVGRAKPGHIPVLQTMHEANAGNVACSLLRTTAHIKNRWQYWPQCRVLTDSQGKVIASFHAERDANCLRVNDVAVASPEYCPALLSACAQTAEEASLAQLRFSAPPSHAFARFLLGVRSTHTMRVEHNAGGMMRVIDLPETLENMIPEWESRLAGHIARDYRTEVTLVVDKTAFFRIRANRGAIDIGSAPSRNKLSLNADELLHLLTGYKHLSDILDSRWALITAEARQLLAAIFPKRHPFVWPLDRF